MSSARSIALVSLAMGASWLAAYALGGAGHVAPHWFYVPILLAAARFGVAGTVVTAAVAGFVGGPLLPLDVATATPQTLSDWASRGGFFVANGLVMAAIFGRLKSTLGREAELVRAERELERHKEAIIQTVSHEFRSPLTTIRGSLDLFAEPGSISEEMRPLLDILESATRRLENLVKLVLAASETLIEPERKREESIALREFCLRAADAVEDGDMSRIRFEASADVIVVCDPELLALPIEAIIHNALRFSPPTSPVEVSARRLLDAVEVRVTDNGSGMSEADLRRVFEPFVQRDESVTRYKQGMGLGLFSARKTVELIGGELELRAGPGGGIEAILTIPQ
jgi:signal transduction histidine kinase